MDVWGGGKGTKAHTVGTRRSTDVPFNLILRTNTLSSAQDN